MTHPPDFRALLARARQKFHEYEMDAEGDAPHEHRRLMQEIDAALSAAPQQEPKGLHGKYIIHRSTDGSPVEFPCFVLRVDGADDAAMAALQSYAKHPSCPPELAADLAEQVQRNASSAVLGAAPQQPSDEAAELSRWLAFEAENALKAGRHFPASMLTSASELLTRYGGQAAPVPVAERLPEDHECNSDGEVWVESPGYNYAIGDTGDYYSEPAKWELRQYSECDAKQKLRWSPHYALPLPEATHD